MILRIVALFWCLTILCSCEAQQNRSTASQEEIYTFTTPSKDGTGKYYLGREIARVMGHLAADWLERPEREREEGVSMAIRNMKLKPSDHIADIGAGSGYYTFRLAGLVPDGKVFAVDLQPQMLEIIRQKVRREKVGNIELVQGQETSPNLTENSVDLALMVDVYHELSHPREMLQQLVRALKPGGKFILLEYRMEDPKVPIKRLHKMSVDQAVKEMKAVGLRLQENKTNLPWQHFMVFVKE
ncbi:MAG: class I SAM-dependent methyltransferase [Lewinella sp.]|nr:class I SAM-dependent methyltransferase [Lewinella sp.]